MVFNIDPQNALNAAMEALEEAGRTFSEEQFARVAEAIEKAMPGVVQTIAQGTTEFWQSEAGSRGGWGEKYARAVKYRVTGTSAEIYADESMMDKTSNRPNYMYVKMIEEGMKSFSITQALLASEKAKTSADGIKYMVVPFPVAVPRRESSGKMRSQFGGREMTSQMHSILRSGGRLTTGTVKSGSREVSVAGLTQVTTKQFHSQYMMFRVASAAGKEWIHPGASPDPVFPDVLDFLNRQIQDCLSEFCRAVVKEYSQ
jgi:hypothetical protein